MTKEEILQAIRSGHTVVLRDQPWHHIAVDLFGELVVDTCRNEEFPPRKATLEDKRNAVIYQKQTENK